MKRWKQLVPLALVLVIVMLFTACWCGPFEEPYMTDYTAKTDARMTAVVRMNPFLDDEHDYRMTRQLLGYTEELPKYGRISEASVETYAKFALRDVLADAYIDDGTRLFPFVQRSAKGTWAYDGGKTYVALRESDGQVLICMDLRVHTNVKKVALKRNVLEISFDLLSLDRAELLLCGAEHLSIGVKPHAGSVTSAEQAYEILLDLVDKTGYGILMSWSGEARVYYSEKANAWIVGGGAYALAIAAEDGSYWGKWDGVVLEE